MDDRVRELTLKAFLEQGRLAEGVTTIEDMTAINAGDFSIDSLGLIRAFISLEDEADEGRVRGRVADAEPVLHLRGRARLRPRGASSAGSLMSTGIPTSWYNIHADLPFEVPADLPPPNTGEVRSSGPQVPKALIWQTGTRDREVLYPRRREHDAYPDVAAHTLAAGPQFEQAIGLTAASTTSTRGPTSAGSHK